MSIYATASRAAGVSDDSRAGLTRAGFLSLTLATAMTAFGSR